MSKPVLEKYLAKHFTGSSHDWAIKHLTTLDKQARILDIGCGSGPIGQALQAAGHTNLFAVEIDSSARAKVKDYYQMVEVSIDNFSGQKFDRIVILDVLEHLTDPDTFLRNALSYLAPDGQVLISVPNIAHWSTRFSLLFGFFEPTDRGILDRTHHQFFTRRRLKKFIKENGLTALELNSSIEPCEFVLPRFIWDNQAFEKLRSIRLWVAQHLPGLFAYQHLAILTK